jgi:hypothetical protein
VPKQTLSSLSVNTAGAVIEDVLVTGAVTVNAPNVTLRRVLIRGTLDNMTNGACRGNGLVIEDSTFEPPGGRNAFWNVDQFQIGQGGYTLRRVQAWHESDGPRIGGAGLGCGPTHIEDSFINIDPSGICGAGGHSDGVQGYGAGAGNTVTNTTIDFENPGGCGGNAGFFFPGGPDNPPPASVTVNRLLIFGNRDNFSFRMGTAGSVQGLRIVNNSWGFGPIVITDLGCSAINPWEAKIVTVDKTTWTVTGTVRDQPCG